jgi:phospholipase/carboxylesterase
VIFLDFRPDGGAPHALYQVTGQLSEELGEQLKKHNSFNDLSFCLMTLLPSEIVETAPSPTASVIWLHGLGADGHDFVPIVREIVPRLTLPPQTGIRFIFPHAPKQAVTINGGYVMRAWYDVISTDLRQRQDRDGILGSYHHLLRLIENEIANGIAANRIVLAGFSQGGAIALYTALRFSKPLAGVLALSTYVPLAESTEEERTQQNQAVPIMMAHGDSDPILPYQAGAESRDLLEKLGYSVSWHSYPMEHSVCAEEVADIAVWLSEVLKSA